MELTEKEKTEKVIAKKSDTVLLDIIVHRPLYRNG